jgi:hypothetical protein
MPRSRELLYRRRAGEAAGKSGGPQGQAVALPDLPAGLIYDDRAEYLAAVLEIHDFPEANMTGVTH